jgi:predicted O-methyltransferase YrrM
MIGDAPKSINTGLPGWESVNEEMQLIALARKVPDGGMIVELGGEFGRSAGQFLFATQGKLIKVMTVDLYPKDHHSAGDLMKAQLSNLTEALGEDVLRHESIRGISWEVGSDWRNGTIDLLFIDAAHDYQAVTNDIDAWVRHVKPGGVVAFHDYAVDDNSHPLHFEVKRAVDQWYVASRDTWTFGGQVDSLVWFTHVLDVTEHIPTFKAVQEPAKPKGKPGRKPKNV